MIYVPSCHDQAFPSLVCEPAGSPHLVEGNAHCSRLCVVRPSGCRHDLPQSWLRLQYLKQNTVQVAAQYEYRHFSSS